MCSSDAKIFIFAVSLFYIIASVKSKEFELELQKYLISNFDNRGFTELKQNLEEGQDSLTFFKGINGSGDGGVWIIYNIQTKTGNDVGGVSICEKPRKNAHYLKFNALVKDILTEGLLQGKKCPIEKNATMQLPNSFKVTSQAPEDIEGIIQLSVSIQFPPFYEFTLRYDVVGTVKAK